MAEPVTLDSNLPILVAFALKSCISLYEQLGFRRTTNRLGIQLHALASALNLLATTVCSSTDVDLSALKLPLLHCGNLCEKALEDLKKAGRWPNTLPFLGCRVDEFSYILGHYETTFKVINSSTNLCEASVIDLRSYTKLIQNATEGLSSEREDTTRRLLTESVLELELQSILESVEKCLELLGLFAGRLKQLLSAKSRALKDVKFSNVSDCVGGDGTKLHEKVDATESAETSLAKNALPPHDKKYTMSERLQYTDILSAIRNEPPSIDLQAYFRRLYEGFPNWHNLDIDTLTNIYIEGLTIFAKVCGSKRDQYFNNPVKGPHYQQTYVERWNQIYSQQPNIWECPLSWRSGLKGEGLDWVITFQGEDLCQGMNEFVQGPATLDCGMHRGFEAWMGIRYIIGDGWLKKLFPFKNRQFTFNQEWLLPMNDDDTKGNLLHSFYDNVPDEMSTNPSESRTRIQAKVIFNHPTYDDRHPAGGFRVHNATIIDGRCIVFDPSALQNIISYAEVEQRLKQAYNAPRSPADLERLSYYEQHPNDIHPHFAPTSNRTLLEKAEKFADHTLDDIAWEYSRPDPERNIDEFHLIFNCQRLMNCLKEARTAYLNGPTNEDIFSRAKTMKLLDEIRSLIFAVQEVEGLLKH